MLEDGRATEKVDVFAFGMMLWEMLHPGEQPYGNMSTWQVIMQVREGKRPEIRKDCPKELGEVIKACWRQEPKEPPDFMELVPRLHSLAMDLRKAASADLPTPAALPWLGPRQQGWHRRC